ncbi:MAG: hypothetical protein LBT39_01595, partial [Treponema sp.]|nr:hypothetical protein [Treponema sp.]
ATGTPYLGYTATVLGGGVSGNPSGSTFIMKGGEISGNTASGSSDKTYGGGVYSPVVFTMNGGEISGNGSSRGGGVCAEGTFTKVPFGGETGSGTIYGSDADPVGLKNTATEDDAYGHAVYFATGLNTGIIRTNTAGPTVTTAAGFWE